MHSRKIALSRYGWFTAGVLLNAFGVALITKAALGTSPISSLPYVLSLPDPADERLLERITLPVRP